MSLSDEILARPGAIAPIRHLLSELVSELGARSAFLVDEAGTPFGAFGNVEFPLPYPISSLTGRAGAAIRCWKPCLEKEGRLTRLRSSCTVSIHGPSWHSSWINRWPIRHDAPR